jgi:hypothetical protein
MRKWPKEIIKQPSTNFFLRNSKQERSCNNLKRISILNCPSKSARYQKWAGNFVMNKIALLLKLNQQVINKRKAREIATG